METSERERLLDPVDRISEVLFGLIMAVTIVGSLSIATAGKDEVRTVMMAALGCNLAWGLVDAVMYVVRTATARARNRALGRTIAGSDPDTARRMIAKALPPPVARIAGTEELEGMRARLVALPDDDRGLVRPRDLLEAFGIFLMVVIATFPVVIPFLLLADAGTAMHLSQAITLAMLFLAGSGLARYAGYRRPFYTGVAMAVFGAILIAVVKALGG